MQSVSPELSRLQEQADKDERRKWLTYYEAQERRLLRDVDMLRREIRLYGGIEPAAILRRAYQELARTRRHLRRYQLLLEPAS